MSVDAITIASNKTTNLAICTDRRNLQLCRICLVCLPRSSLPCNVDDRDWHRRESSESRQPPPPTRLIVPKAPEFLLRLGERMLTAVTRIWRGLFAYQIIIVAQRR